MSSVSIDGLADAVADALTDYRQDVANVLKNTSGNEAEVTVDDLKKSSPKKTGKYAKAWKKKKVFEDHANVRYTVYNSKGQLTHLNENGHQLRNGGRSKAQPHIRPAEQRMIKRYEESVENGVNKI